MSTALRRLALALCALVLVLGLVGRDDAARGQDAKTEAKTAEAKTAEAKTAEAKTAEAKKTEAKKTEAKNDAAALAERVAKLEEHTGIPKGQAPPPQARASLAKLKGQSSDLGSSFFDRFMSFVGLLLLLSVCYLICRDRARISWRVVGWGVGLQVTLGFLIMVPFPGLGFPLLRPLFALVNDLFVSLLGFTGEGAKFLFGSLALQNNVPVGPGGPHGPTGPSGLMASVGAFFAFGVLPTIIFFSSLMAVLYHVGFMQAVVKGVAIVMQRTMRTTGAETLAASGNIFVGQTEAPLLVRPFIKGMSQSELMAVMTAGFATVAGGVMAAYVFMLQGYFSDIAGHLLAASVMSAPAALVCAKLMIPEPDPEKCETFGQLKVQLEQVDANVIDAAARGAGDGLKLALNVGAMLLAFIALIALLNGVLGWGANRIADLAYGKPWKERVAAARAELAALPADASDERRAEVAARFEALAVEASGAGPARFEPKDERKHRLERDGTLVFGPGALEAERPALLGVAGPHASPYRGGGAETAEGTWRTLSFQKLIGWLLAPLAFLLGVPWVDCKQVGELIGVKTVLNEFVAYLSLADMLAAGKLEHPRSVVIAIYALCGFANFSSIAIQIGGIGGIAPERRSDLARLGLMAMLAGTIACLMTATVAGMLM